MSSRPDAPPSADGWMPCSTEAVSDNLSRCVAGKEGCAYTLRFGWYVYCGHPLHRHFREGAGSEEDPSPP